MMRNTFSSRSIEGGSGHPYVVWCHSAIGRYYKQATPTGFQTSSRCCGGGVVTINGQSQWVSNQQPQGELIAGVGKCATIQIQNHGRTGSCFGVSQSVCW